MTVAEVIAELQRMPNQNAPVEVRIDVANVHDTGAVFEWAHVDQVRNQGPFVELELR